MFKASSIAAVELEAGEKEKEIWSDFWEIFFNLSFNWTSVEF